MLYMGSVFMRSRSYSLLLLLVISFVSIMCSSSADENLANEKQALIEDVKSLYLEGIAHFEGSISGLHAAAYRYDSSETRRKELKEAFFKARESYKRIEAMSEYYSPVTSEMLNGPPLSEIAEDDPNDVEVLPEGFQVIEPLIFGNEPADRVHLLERIKVIKSCVPRLRMGAGTIAPSREQLIDALKLQIARISSMGISGFDSPEAQNSLPEARASLEGIATFVRLLDRDGTSAKSIQDAVDRLKNATDFDSFDRLAFIKDHLNLISSRFSTLAIPGQLAGIDSRRLLRPSANSIFAKDAFNPFAFAPSAEQDGELAAQLGQELFFDPIMSIDRKRACVSCHQPDKAFTDGLKTSRALTAQGIIKRNAPTLVNAGLQSSNFWDSRATFLEDQIREVVVNKDEMHGSFEHAVRMIKADKEYPARFEKAYGKAGVTESNVRKSIAAYIRSLVSLSSRFDRHVRGEEIPYSAEEKLGFNIFMGKGKCGTCHFTPLFNGVVPPAYTKTEVEVIGTPANTDTLRPVLDEDRGRFVVHENHLHDRAFKTPTIRNIALTAPYMHNGVFKTLEEVVDFYNRGGGLGLGLKVENQTLPGARLDLSQQEKDALVAFMRSLTDTTGFTSLPASVRMRSATLKTAKY